MMAEIPSISIPMHLKDMQENPTKKSEEPKTTNSHSGEEKVEREEKVPDQQDNTSNFSEAPSRSKKRRSKKSKSQRGLDKPTGMEDFFADRPMTAEESRELQRIYADDLPFLDRLLTAIQRFERTRKLTNERRDVFYKWLHFGGVTIGPNVGGSGQDKEEMDKDEIAAATSKVSIPAEIRHDLESTGPNSKYMVDFLGCTQAFLSRPASSLFGFETKERVKIVTTTIERFMDYLMQNDVCYEYYADILETRNFCREATEQLWSISEAQRWFPGEFNIACSTLFDGNYAHDYDGDTYWGDQNPGEAVFVGLTPDKATQIIGFGIVGTASNKVYQKYSEILEQGGGEALEVVEVIQEEGFEIVKIEYPTSECKDLYTQNSVEYRPLGKITAKSWRDPEAPPEDLTDEEKKAGGTMARRTYVFFIEEIILQHLSIGQKVVATIRELNCGIWFFDEFIRIYPNFDLLLLNEITEGFKEPKLLPDALPWEGAFEDEANGDDSFDVVPTDPHNQSSLGQPTGSQEPTEHDDRIANCIDVEAQDDQEPY